MSLDPIVTRRVLLAAGAGTAGAVALAACSSSSPTKSAPSTGADESSGSGGSSPSSSAPAGGASAAGGSDDSGGGGSDDNALATLSAVPVGGAISVKLPNGKPGIVARPTSTTAVAFSAICTHQGCTVKPQGSTLDCPCHGSKYDAKTGKVLGGPAPSPLAKVAVTVKDGKVLPG